MMYSILCSICDIPDNFVEGVPSVDESLSMVIFMINKVKIEGIGGIIRKNI